jgi:uncharacterized protein YndB with AHSA1/START domain
MTPAVRPDLSDRPLAGTVECDLAASPQALYDTWVDHVDTWFAAPGTVAMRTEVGEPFFFETHHAGSRHPHYGRFLRLERPRLIELTWVTGVGGTGGAETILTVELTPRGSGTAVRLTHAGWLTAEARDANAAAWPMVLAQLDAAASAASRS